VVGSKGDTWGGGYFNYFPVLKAVSIAPAMVKDTGKGVRMEILFKISGRIFDRISGRIQVGVRLR
jgi:hypothetical protein